MPAFIKLREDESRKGQDLSTSDLSVFSRRPFASFISFHGVYYCRRTDFRIIGGFLKFVYCRWWWKYGLVRPFQLGHAVKKAPALTTKDGKRSGALSASVHCEIYVLGVPATSRPCCWDFAHMRARRTCNNPAHSPDIWETQFFDRLLVHFCVKILSFHSKEGPSSVTLLAATGISPGPRAYCRFVCLNLLKSDRPKLELCIAFGGRRDLWAFSVGNTWIQHERYHVFSGPS